MEAGIRVVLHQPGIPGNLGSIARAVAHLGLEDVVIVGAAGLKHQPEARMMAVHVGDVLDRFREVDHLEEALLGCELVLGTSARPHTDGQPPLGPEEALAYAARRPGRVALLFGSEKYGLPTEALRRCDHVVRLPSRRDGESFNLAQAVLLLGWEFTRPGRTPAPAVDRLHRFEVTPPVSRALEELGVLKAHHRDKKLMTLRRLLARLDFSEEEAALVRHVASKVALLLGLRPPRPRPAAPRGGQAGDEDPAVRPHAPA